LPCAAQYLTAAQRAHSRGGGARHVELLCSELNAHISATCRPLTDATMKSPMIASIMNKRRLAALILVTSPSMYALAAGTGCPPGVDPKASTPLATVSSASGCGLHKSAGYWLPDSQCTPGAINSSVDLAVLQSGQFKTTCERNKATSVTKKQSTYAAYGVKKPANNTGAKQTCELDHLISLELGGADTLDNIWPQCGPAGVKLAKRYFKIKDGVENYLAVQVRTGAIPLEKAQHEIASDWTQFIDQAAAYWASHSAKGFGSDQ
jgi:hypothetical protein